MIFKVPSNPYHSMILTFAVLPCFFLFPPHVITEVKFVFCHHNILTPDRNAPQQPREPTAKAALRMSWQGTLSEASSWDPLPGTLHLVLTPCLCALAHLQPRPPTWTVAFGFQHNTAVAKKPFGCLTPSTGWIHPGIITHQRLFIFFMSFTGSTAKDVNTAFYPS